MIFLKILLFPVMLLLSLIISFTRFLCVISSSLLSMIAVMIFLVSLFALFSGEFAVFFGVAVIAWLISPYGIPRLAIIIVETFNIVNMKLKRFIFGV